MNGGMTDTLISGRAILEEEKGKTPQHIEPTRKGWLFYCRRIAIRYGEEGVFCLTAL